MQVGSTLRPEKPVVTGAGNENGVRHEMAYVHGPHDVSTVLALRTVMGFSVAALAIYHLPDVDARAEDTVLQMGYYESVKTRSASESANGSWNWRYWGSQPSGANVYADDHEHGVVLTVTRERLGGAEEADEMFHVRRVGGISRRGVNVERVQPRAP